mmetsp:Transcript_12420/g.37890  ORF Transcript_12420/g.37890 Transcript_12420/m.37890 type:complete len:467 (+) Transcript_12420:245-1645(+)
MVGLMACTTKEVAGAGRGVIATTGLPRSSKVCLSEAVGGVAPNAALVKDVCHLCLMRASELGVEGLKQCSSCKFAKYCSKKHQRMAWELDHKAECEALGKLKMKGVHRVPEQTVRCAARVLWTLQSSKLPRIRTIVALMFAHLDHCLEVHGDELICTAVVLAEYLGRVNSRELRGIPPPEDFMSELNLLCRISCNGHSVANSQLESLALGLFPEGAFFNHSCEPNCVQTFSFDERSGKVVLVVRTVSPVRKDEELTISYCDPLLPVVIRREQIRKGFNFECQCARCQRELLLYSGKEPPHLLDQALMKEALRAVLAEKGVNSVLSHVQRMLKSENVRDKIIEVQSWRTLMVCLMEKPAGREAAVLECCRLAKAALDAADVNKYCPSIPILYAAIGETLWYWDRPHDAETSFQQAVSLLEVVYGNQDNFVLNLTLKIESLRADQRMRNVGLAGAHGNRDAQVYQSQS